MFSSADVALEYEGENGTAIAGPCKAVLAIVAQEGWGSEVEQEILIELTQLGMIEVDGDGNVVLTDEGHCVYRKVKPR